MYLFRIVVDRKIKNSHIVDWKESLTTKNLKVCLKTTEVWIFPLTELFEKRNPLYSISKKVHLQ